MSVDKKQKAAEIQQFVDWEFNVDLSTFSNAELRVLTNKINSFLELDVSTDELNSAESFADDGDDLIDDSMDGDFDDEEEGEYDDWDDEVK
jgi:hypothetical protein